MARRFIDFLRMLADRLDRDTHVTLSPRPMVVGDLDALFQPDYRHDCAIVLQGPILSVHDFTANTIRTYRQYFPNAPIIVSTWNSEPLQVLKALEHVGAHVIVQRPPKHPGVSHLNYQIASSSAGVRAALDFGASFVAKTRTDQRLYSPNALRTLTLLGNAFPLAAKVETQQARIVGISLNTFKFRMYGLSDMLIFGDARDLRTFWERPLDERPASDSKSVNWRDDALAKGPEVELCTHFLEQTGWEVKWTLADSWSAFAQRFVIADASSLDLYWPKYSNLEHRWREYGGSPRFEEICFPDWLEFRFGRTPTLAEEQILNVAWDAAL